MALREHRSTLVVFAACIAAQFLPLLNVLGYEYSMFVGAVVTLLTIPHAVRCGDAREGSWWITLRDSARRPLGWVGLALVVSLLNMARVRNCEPGTGLIYLGLFGLGALPMALATGLLASKLGGRRRWVFAYGVVFASVASTLGTLALQPAIVAYDTFFGYYAGSIYDESLISVLPHVTYRGWSLLWCALVVSTLEFSRSGKRFEVKRMLWIAAAIAALFGFRGDLGLDRSRAYVIEDLGGLAETEHFEIHYDLAYFDARAVELLISDHEARYAELAEFWETEPALPLRSFVYGSQARKGDLMGGRRTLVAKVWLGEMHITWRGLGDELLAHEMAHLFLREDGYGPLRLSSRGGLLPIMALVEGAATSAAWGATELDYHHWAAAIYAIDRGEDITDLLGPTGFWSRYSRLAYTLTGSFGRWLIDERGPQSFRAAYRRGDFVGAYGQTLPELLEEWRAFLGTLELTDGQLETARYRYDRATLFGRLCARSIATRFDQGQEFIVGGRTDDARACFEGILEDDPNNIGYRLTIAETYARMGLREDALRHARQVAASEGAGRSSIDRATELLADWAWTDGDFEFALITYEELLSRAGTEGSRRRLLAKTQAIAERAQFPLAEQAVRRTLVDRPAAGSAAAAAELGWAAATEGSTLARYLALLRMEDDGRSPLYGDVFASVSMERLQPPQRRRVLESRAMHLTRRGSAEACEAWNEVQRAALPGSSLSATAEMWRGRCARGTLPPPS
ncbi:MAG: tetratricopeptide (TPR) repeat protein [Bradymonadia bacterium]